MIRRGDENSRSFGPRMLTVIASVVVVQTIAAVFFIADALLDIAPGVQVAGAFFHGLELLVALALGAGVVMGVLVLRRLIAEARQRDRTVALARGAMAEIVEQRFAEWGLTDAESEVALFAVKGYGVAEIARLRDSAMGTVRAQLSRVYVKAGVTNQAMLIGSFIDEFLDVIPVRGPGRSLVQTQGTKAPAGAQGNTEKADLAAGGSNVPR